MELPPTRRHVPPIDDIHRIAALNTTRCVFRCSDPLLCDV